MTWFNYYGLAIIIIVMIPNVIYAIRHKGGGATYKNKAACLAEQIGRYGCLVFMVFNLPYTWIGFYFSFGEIVYLVINSILLAAYCITFAVCKGNTGIVSAVLLSALPSLIFLFSAIMIASVPLFVFSVVFSITHILISVKSAPAAQSAAANKRKGAIAVAALFTAAVLLAVGTIGSIVGYRFNSLKRLEGMSAREMIAFNCKEKNAKLSVAVVENGKTDIRVYGNKGEESKLYDYEIGSVSKTFVALLCAKAASEGKLALSDGIGKYLDPGAQKYYPTLERLLSHTSGYRAYYFENRMIANKLAHVTNDFYGIGKAQILNTVKNVSLCDKDYPFLYSNFGIAAVGLVLEQVYGDDFTHLLNEYILGELGLQNTKAARQDGNLENYWKWKQTDGYIPAGSIISNIGDMAEYLKIFLFDKISYASDCYAEIKKVEAKNAAYEKMNIRIDGVGMTWISDEQNGIIWHNGATTDFNSYLGFTRDKKKGVVVLSNLKPDEKISSTVIGAKLLTSQCDL